MNLLQNFITVMIQWDATDVTTQIISCTHLNNLGLNPLNLKVTILINVQYRIEEYVFH